VSLPSVLTWGSSMAGLDNLLSGGIGAVIAGLITFLLTTWHERSKRRAEEELRALDLLVDSLEDYDDWKASGDDQRKRTCERVAKMRLLTACKLGFRYEDHWQEAISLAEDMGLVEAAIKANLDWVGKKPKKEEQAIDRLAELAVKHNRQRDVLTAIGEAGQGWFRVRRVKRRLGKAVRLHDLARQYAAGQLIDVSSSVEGR